MAKWVGDRSACVRGLLFGLIWLALAVPGDAATFGLGTLISIGNGASLAAGNDGTASAVSGNAPSFQDGNGRWFQIVYQKPTNTLQIQIFDGATNSGNSTTLSYNPTGGAAVGANAIWTIPAAAFFVQATPGTPRATSISLTNLALTGLSGGLNIINPMQQTSLTAVKGAGGSPGSSGQTTIQSGDIVFQGDSNGSWMLSGLLTLVGVNGNGATGTQLAFGFSGSASPVPETSSFLMVGMGLAAVFVSRRKKNRGTEGKFAKVDS